MTVRSSRETLESLRVTLQKLEQTTDATADGRDVAELQQILLNRIAELEALNALQPAGADTSNVSAPSDLPHLAAVTEEEATKDVMDTMSLEKLN